MTERKWLLSAIAALTFFPAIAAADYIIKDGNGVPKTILSGLVSGKILNYSAQVDGSGNVVASLRASSTAPGSNLAVKSGAGALYDLTVNIGATTGWLLLFDAVSLPSNGAVTPIYCWPIASNGTNGAAAFAWPQPLRFTTGLTAGFSTTGCAILTASATASFFGGYQ